MRVHANEPREWLREPKGDRKVIIDDSHDAGDAVHYVRSHTDFDQTGEWVAYSATKTGDAGYQIVVRRADLPYAREDQIARIANVGRDFVFCPSGKRLFYLRLDEANRPYQVWCRQLTTQVDDVLLLEEPDEGLRVSVKKSRSDALLIVRSHSATQDTVWTGSLSGQLVLPELRMMWHPSRGAVASVDEIRTSAGNYIIGIGSVDSSEAVWYVDQGDPSAEPRVLLDSSENHLVRLQAFESFLAIEYRQNATAKVGYIPASLIASQLRAKKRGLHWRQVRTAPAGHDPVHLDDNPAWAQKDLHARKTSLVAPDELLVGDTLTNSWNTIPRPLGPEQEHAYLQRRIDVPAQDGVMIPVYVASKRDTGSAEAKPLVVHVYGAYGVINDPRFTPATIALLDEGFAVALVQTRGGGERGPAWWRAGAREHKLQTVWDLIACVEYLISSGVAAAGAVTVEGHSAGGFAAAAAANLKPGLFAALVASNPFVDLLGSLTDPSLPLTYSDWSEWGNPLASDGEFDRIRSLSPYENLPSDCTTFPNVFTLSSVQDKRVSIVEPTKWVARIRDRGGRAVMHVRMHGGHTYSGSLDGLTETAELLAWICSQGTERYAKEGHAQR